MKYKQLKALSIVSILIGILSLIDNLIYEHTIPQSISYVGTTGVIGGMLLPIALGALALFSFTYSHYTTATWKEKTLVLAAGIGMLIVALFPCLSEHDEEVAHMTLFYVTPQVSNIFHMIGAGIGFLSLLAWILFYFTKADKTTRKDKTKQVIYETAGLVGLAGLGVFAIGSVSAIAIIIMLIGLLAGAIIYGTLFFRTNKTQYMWIAFDFTSVVFGMVFGNILYNIIPLVWLGEQIMLTGIAIATFTKGFTHDKQGDNYVGTN